MLHRHGVAHVFNSWTRMPPVIGQLPMAGSIRADFVAARFLVTPGRTYENAVAEFSPYKETKVTDADTRAAGNKKASFIYVDDRLEGNALKTIKTMLEIPGVA